MTDSKDEMEIVSTVLDDEEANKYLLSLKEADNKAGHILKTITQLKNEILVLETDCEHTRTKDLEISDKKQKIASLIEEYKDTVNQVHKLAKMINFNVEELQNQKFDIDQYKINNTHIMDAPTVAKDCERELIAPVIIINDEGRKNPKVFIHDRNDCGPQFCETDNESICSCNDECESSDLSTCEVSCKISNQCFKPPEKSNIDCEKAAIRDDLMTMKGEVKLLHLQNRDLLCKLNNANKRTVELSNILQSKPGFNKCKEECGKSVECSRNVEEKTNKQLLMNEIDRLRDELKEVKRDRCQIELARKMLNIADTQCANCLGSQGDSDKIKLDSLTDEYNRVLADRDCKALEIAELRKSLEEAKHGYKTYEDCLLITKIQVNQLEKQLFDLKSAKTHDPDLVCSNDKYVIENLRHHLKEANEEKTNMQIVLDFHLTELEDKKAKYLAVLQVNQEQKHRIENLCKEKATIANEYEAEFNRMNEHLKRRLEEIGKLPGMLEYSQRELEKERLLRSNLEKERCDLLENIEQLKACLEEAKRARNDKKYKEVEKQNTQLRAMIKTLEDTLEENKRLYMERTHYSLQLKEHLDTMREEAALQVTKVKDFSECQRIKFAENIQKLEEQLAKSRAMACAEFKKRDNVDERLRNRIDVLTVKLNEAHLLIGELVNAKQLMETKAGEEMCKIPRMIDSACKDFNVPKTVMKYVDS